jgi:hypothetical protein
MTSTTNLKTEEIQTQTTHWSKSEWFMDWERLAYSTLDRRKPEGYWYYDSSRKTYIYEKYEK